MQPLGLRNTVHGQAPQLENGTLYQGSVTDVDMTTGRVTVKVDGSAQPVTDVIPASNIISGLFGYRVSYYPPPSTRVLLLKGPTSFIVGYLPGPILDPSGAENLERTTGAAALGRNERKVYKVGGSLPDLYAKSHKVPVDMLEGEFDMTNLLGVGITLLTNLAKLSAGDMAKVEVLLLNDTVRIVSRNFRHVSSFGNTEIIEDGGRVTCRVVGTGYEHEAWNRAAQTDRKIEAADGQVEMSPEEFTDLARWRYAQYIGYLGDFFNDFISDPIETVGQVATQQSGKSRIYRGGDGTVLIQSVKEIGLERVVRIPVPIEKRKASDPAGNKSTEFGQFSGAALNYIRPWKHSRPESLHHGVFQLRQYARWLSGLYSMARFHQLDKDWSIATEDATDAPDKLGNKEPDRAAVAAGLDPAPEGYACIRIMLDGSIILQSADGSAVTMAGGNLTLSASKHLFIEAAGDVNVVAGGSFNVRARENIEFMAVVGGLILKSRTWWKAICEQGSFRFRTEAVNPAVENPPEPAAGDPAPEALPFGFVVESTKSGIALEATNLKLRTTAADGDVVVVAPRGAVDIKAKNDISLASQTGFLKLRAGQAILTAAQRMLNRLSRGIFDINTVFTVRNARLEVANVVANRVASKLVVSEQRKRGRDEHENHVSSIPQGQEESVAYSPRFFGDGSGDDTGTAYGGGAVAASAQVWSTETIDYETSNPVLPDRPMDLSGVYTNPEFLFESVTQQYLRLDKPDVETDYEVWSWASDYVRMTGALQRYSWPGTAPSAWRASVAGASLHVPLSADYKSLPNEAAPLQRAPVQFRFLKRSS